MIHNLKPYPAYKDSGVPWLGKVPEHWEVKRLKRVAKLNPSKSEFTSFLTSNVDATFLPMERVGVEGGIDTREIKPASDLLNSGFTYFRRGDVLIAKITPCFENGKGACLEALPTEIGFGSTEFIVSRPIPSVLSKFFYRITTLSEFRNLGADAMTGAAGQKRVPMTFVGNFQAAIPSLLEQQRIVNYLDYIDRRIRHYIRAKKKLIKLLEEQKQAIIHQAVTRGLDPNVKLKPSWVEWLGDIPEHWEVLRISHFSKVGNGSTPSRSNSAYWSSGTYPWLNSSNVNRGFIDSSNQFVTDTALKECHLPHIPAGSVLVAITGQGKTRGTAAVLEIEATINQHIAFITPKSNIILSEYLQLVLVGAYQTLRAISDDSGSTKGALTCEDLKRFKLAIPPLKEQKNLVAHIRVATRRLTDTIDSTYQEISLLREYRTRLIADVVTGKLDVREAAANLSDKSNEIEVEDDFEEETIEESLEEVVTEEMVEGEL